MVVKPVFTKSEDVRDYRVLGQIGKGGEGEVYLAVHRERGTLVALKVLSPEQQKNPDRVADFKRGAEKLRFIDHDAVVRFIELFEINGLSVLVTEYAPGPDLRELLEAPGGKPTVGQALALIESVLEGLVAIHSHQLIHRDIKLENLIFDLELERVRIIDVGILRGVNERHTATGVVKMTPSYCCPAILEGKPATFRTDLFAVGVALFRLIMGDARARFTWRSDGSPNLDGLSCSAEVLALLDALLQRDPARRPASTQSALDMLRRAPELAWLEKHELGGMVRAACPSHDGGTIIDLDDDDLVADQSRKHRPPPPLPVPKKKLTEKVNQKRSYKRLLLLLFLLSWAAGTVWLIFGRTQQQPPMISTFPEPQRYVLEHAIRFGRDPIIVETSHEETPHQHIHREKATLQPVEREVVEAPPPSPSAEPLAPMPKPRAIQDENQRLNLSNDKYFYSARMVKLCIAHAERGEIDFPTVHYLYDMSRSYIDAGTILPSGAEELTSGYWVKQSDKLRALLAKEGG
jgi:serine/threonine protein kinase